MTVVSFLLSINNMAKLIFGLQKTTIAAELTLAPSGDEILPVRSQELQIIAFPAKTRLAKFSSVPLGMEYN